MKNLLIALVSLISLGAFAQAGQVKKADELFDRYAYAEAIRVYQKLDDNGVSDYHILRNLAHSYWEVRDFGMAEQYFAQVVNISTNADDFYYYAESLKANGAYDDAQIWMSRYHEMKGHDRRAKMHVENPDYVKTLKAEPDRFTIQNTGASGPGADFGTAFFQDKVIFLSSRHDGAGVKRTFKWTNAPFLDMYIADRELNGELRNIRRFDEKINSVMHEGPVTFTPDGKTMYFTRNNYTQGKAGKSADNVNRLKIYFSVLTEAGWTTEHEFLYNSADHSMGHPSISSDGQKLYFCSDKEGGFGGVDIYMCTWNHGTWTAPVNLGPGINTEGDEMFPFVHMDGTLYFSSSGHPGLGGLDVFEAKEKNGFFYKVMNLGFPLNSNCDDFGFILAGDKASGYVSSNRQEGMGDDDIYYFTMAPEKTLSLTGFVINQNNSEPLVGAEVKLFDADGLMVKSSTIADNGKFDFVLDREKCGYYLEVRNGDMWTNYISEETSCDDPTGTIDLGFLPLMELSWAAKGTVMESGSLAPIEGFVVTLTDKNTGAELVEETAGNGSVTFKLEKDSDYTIRFEKEGFFAKTGMFTTVGMEPGMLEIDKFIDLTFDKIELNKGIRIDNIYYDYNKSFIRKDAAAELDKIVEILIDNPTMEIELGSHTDARGSENYNQSLSQKRAKAAAEYILSQGIAAHRLSWKGYGEASLINNCADGIQCSDELHEENRRTEFKVLSY